MFIVLDKFKVKEVIKRWMNLKVPGLYESIEPLCFKICGRNCLDLFLDEPDKFKEILLMQFKDQNFIYFLIRYAVIRPLLKELGREELEEDLAINFITNIDKFKTVLGDVIVAA